MSKRMETKLPIVGIRQFRMRWQCLYLSRARLWECCLGVEEKCEKLDCCLLFVISPFKLYLQRGRVENWCQNSHLVNVDCTFWKALSHPNFQGRHSTMDFEPTNYCNFKPLRNTHGHWMWLARSPQKRKVLTWTGEADKSDHDHSTPLTFSRYFFPTHLRLSYTSPQMTPTHSSCRDVSIF